MFKASGNRCTQGRHHDISWDWDSVPWGDLRDLWSLNLWLQQFLKWDLTYVLCVLAHVNWSQKNKDLKFKNYRDNLDMLIATILLDCAH